MFPKAKPRETLRSRGNKTHCFPSGPVIKCLLLYHNVLLLGNEKRTKKRISFVFHCCGFQIHENYENIRRLVTSHVSLVY